MKNCIIVLLSLISSLQMSARATSEGDQLSKIIDRILEREEVTPDSIYPGLDLLKSRIAEFEAAADEASHVKALVYTAALARLYADRTSLAQVYSRKSASHPDSLRQWSRREWLEGSRRLFARVLREKDVLLGEKTAGWKPYVIQGKDERLFGADMLSVIWMGMRSALPDDICMQDSTLSVSNIVSYYLSRNMPEAALYLEMEYGKPESEERERLLHLKEKYLFLADEAGSKALKNSAAMRELQTRIDNDSINERRPYLHIRTEGVSYPGDSIRMFITSRGIHSISFQVYRLSDQVEEHELTPAKAKRCGKLISRRDFITPLHPDTESDTDTISPLVASDPGMYAIVFSGSTNVRLREKSVSQVIPLRVSRLFIHNMPDPSGDGSTTYVVDGKSGKPLKGACVQLQSADSDNKWRTISSGTTSADGSFHHDVNVTEAGQRVFAWIKGDTCLPYVHLGRFYHGSMPATTQQTIRIYTDRSIYRPGQQVNISGLVYNQKHWAAMVCQDCHLDITLVNPEGKSRETKQVTTDSLGTFTTTFNLPEDDRLGSWSIRASCKDSHGGRNGRVAWQSFDMAEYKRPGFYVELTASADSLCRISGRALYYNGTPVAHARVDGVAERTACWWLRTPERQKSHALDTIYTDTQGRFSYTLPIDTTTRQKGSSLYCYPHLRVETYVLSPIGETQSAEVRVRLFPDPPVEEEKESWFVCRRDTFSFGEDAQIRISADSSTSIFLRAYATNAIVMDTLLHIQDSLLLDIPYRSEYGDGLMLNCWFVKDGQFFGMSHNLYKRLPDTRLRLHWDTFRNFTQPGSQQQWTLRIHDAMSHAVTANLMLTIYDASLDAISPHLWSLGVNRIHLLPNNWLRWFRYNQATNYVTQSFIPWTKASWTPSLSLIDTRYVFRRYSQESHNGLLFDMVQPLKSRVPVTMAQMKSVAVRESPETEVATSTFSAESVSTESEIDPILLRSDFSETGIFLPQVRTDAQGVASVSFTLPQSLTTWHLIGVAHTKDMKVGHLDERIVCQKSLMAELFLPRYCRTGDKLCISAKVRSQANKDQKGRVVVEISSSTAPDRVLKIFRSNFHLASEQDTTYQFTLIVPETEGIQVRIVAKTEDDSDGELREIPVMDTMASLTSSRALTLELGASKDIDTRSLFPEGATNRILVVEKTDNPVCTAVSALQPLTSPEHADAISVSSAYFASTLLGTDDRMAFVNRLSQMQQADGSLSWYPGMHGSLYITLTVVSQLMHLPMLADETQIVAERILDKAYRYLLTELQHRLSLRPKDWTSSLQDLQLGYTLSNGMPPSQDRDNVIAEICKHIASQPATMGNEYLALTHLLTGDSSCKSTLERRLTQEDGYYLAYPGGNRTSIDDRLHVHALVMEVFHNEADNTIFRGMQRWLLNEKRTQGWNTPLSCTQAVWALSGFSLRNIHEAMSEGSGYSRDTISVHQDRIHITGGTHETWVGVHASYSLPYSKVSGWASDMHINSEYAFSEASTGDRATMRTVLTTDRDYEYVSVSLPRPANAEPMEQTSGLRWKDGLIYYCEVHDDRTDCFFESIPRGTYILEDTHSISRPGQYNGGVPTAECMYAPEFRSHGKPITLKSR